MDKIKYTVYQTTNLINNNIYVGVHKTNNPNDSYMGSGTLIVKAFKKHGRKNFKKTVLYTYDTKEDAYQKEQELVDENFIKRRDVYNAKIGGWSGFSHTNETRQKIGLKHRNKITSEKTRGILSKQKIGSRNPQFKGYFKTPLGIFESSTKAASVNKVSYTAVRNRCYNSSKIIRKNSMSRGSDITLKDVGKSWKDLGWDFEPI